VPFASRCSRLLAGLSLLSFVALSPGLAAAEAPDLPANVEHQELAGDVLLIGMPLAALALTFWMDDPDLDKSSESGNARSRLFDVDTILRMNGRPRHDLMLAMGRTVFATYALKYSVGEERPNGKDDHSFPSGHTAVTFAGAEFVRKEYGWWWGVPAYTLASFVGYSRVKSQNHYTADVLAGVAIGVLANHDLSEFLTPFGNLSFGPMLHTTRSLHGTPGLPYREEYGTQFSAPSIGFELQF
jgi:membrane-associated phospholipid phosphatase